MLLLQATEGAKYTTMKMLLTFIYLILIINCTSSNDDKIIEGELYIKSIELGSFYPLNQDEANKKLEDLSKHQSQQNSKELIDYYKNLNSAKLLDKPWINLISKEGEKIREFVGWMSQVGVDQGYMPVQPIHYSHRIHAIILQLHFTAPTGKFGLALDAGFCGKNDGGIVFFRFRESGICKNNT